MQSELALQRLNEVREVVDGDVAELVDTLAKVIVLQKDISNPMYGAKITYIDTVADYHYDDDEDEAYYTLDWDDVDFFDPDGYPVSAHRAIVFDADVHNAGDGETKFWDPNREEYKLPSEYPMGSVNAVYGMEDRSLADDYNSDVRVASSIVPADDPTHPQRYSYTPGWELADDPPDESRPDELPIDVREQ